MRKDEAEPTRPQPTKFGRFVLQHAARAGFKGQSDLARAAGVSQSTVSRWIYSEGRPSTSKLDSLAEVLDIPYGEVLLRAGHGKPADEAEPLPELHPLALELDHMLAEDSPLDENDRELLATMIERIIEPYRKDMRRRRRTA